MTTSTDNLTSPSQIIIENDISIIKPTRSFLKETLSSVSKETLYKSTVKTLKDKMENIAIRVDTVHLVIKYIMELTEETPFKGAEQKEFALTVMREIFMDLTDGEDEVILLKLLDDGVISNMIDLIVDASKGKLNINSVITTGYTCLSLGMKLFRKKNKQTQQTQS